MAALLVFAAIPALALEVELVSEGGVQVDLGRHLVTNQVNVVYVHAGWSTDSVRELAALKERLAGKPVRVVVIDAVDPRTKAARQAGAATFPSIAVYDSTLQPAAVRLDTAEETASVVDRLLGPGADSGP